MSVLFDLIDKKHIQAQLNTIILSHFIFCIILYDICDCQTFSIWYAMNNSF